jgi:biopolymer transport protein ExbD
MSKAMDMVQEEAKTDMTPMIDCVFLLIIFFLCIEFKILEAKLPAYLPKDSGAQKTDSPPIEKLSLKIERIAEGTRIPRRPKDPKSTAYRVEGHKVRYHVMAAKVSEVDDLVRELEKIYKDRSKWHKDEKTGEMKPMPVVIEPGVGAVYGDVASCVDAAKKVGFGDIQFGGGMGQAKK